MILWFAGALFFALRLGAYKRWPLALIALVTAALVVLTYGQVSLAAHREGVVPLDFLKGFLRQIF